jgi:farnesyl diphosphate synthase
MLVGDALQPLAFQLLASDPALPAAPAVRVRLVEILAHAAGSLGMAGGQAIDLAAQGKRLPIDEVELMHARKTGALIQASVLLAAACVPDLPPAQHQALEGFAVPIGLAFQIQDDLLDVLGDTQTLGKTAGADSERGKPTHPAVIGIAASQERVRLLHAQALASLAPFGGRAAPLSLLADWLLSRRY